MPTEISETPIADKLAAMRVEQDPNAMMFCPSCRLQYRVLAGDHASFRCHRCGYIIPEDMAAAMLKSWVDGEAERERDAIAAEIAQVAEAAPKPNPLMLDDMIGNPDATRQLRTALDGFAFDLAQPGAPKWLPFPHTILSGPGGTGKTCLAEIIARELGRKLHLQLGQTLSTPAKIADVLLALRPGEVLFIDEIHGLPPKCQESLYRAMEDGILIPVSRTGQPASKPVRLAPFTLIGATTDEWGLLPSMCQRFKYRVRLSRMTPAEIAQALTQRAARAGWTYTPDAIAMIASRSLGTPRLAIGLLDGCLVTAKAQGGRDITVDIVTMTCRIWEIDSLGLDRVARQYMEVLADGHGDPVRLNVIASKLDGLSKTTVERKIECDLVWLSLIEKRSDGRVLTQAGMEHLRKEK